MNYLILDCVDYNRHFNRHRNLFLNLSDFLNLDNFFNNFLNSHNLWYFHYTIDNLLDDLLNLDHFRDNPKDFQNVINIDNSHNFLVNHTDDSLIDFKCNSSS